MQYFLIIVFLFLMFYGFIQRGKVNYIPNILIILSLLAIFFISYPSWATYIANRTGVGRGADLILYLSVALTSIILVFIGVALKKNHDDLTELARYVALKGAVRNDD